MNVECLLTCGCMLSCRKPDYTQYPAVRPFVDDSQLTEVFVQCYQDTLLTMGDGENLIISRILLPVTRPRDIVPSCPQLRYGTAPDAGIQEQLHPSPGTRRGSTRSRPTRRRA